MNVESGFAGLLKEVGTWALILVAAALTFIYFPRFDADPVATSQPELQMRDSEGDAESVPADDGEGTVTAEGEGADAEAASTDGFQREAHLAADSNGHFYADAYINNQSISVVVDTGATGVVLTGEDAERIGLTLTDADYTMTSRTANGTSKVAPVKLDEVRIGDIVVRDVDAYVAEPGALFATLLGMTFLSRLESVGIRGRELVLVQ